MDENYSSNVLMIISRFSKIRYYPQEPFTLLNELEKLCVAIGDPCA